MICNYCHQKNCLVLLHKEAFNSKLCIFDDSLSNGKSRNHLYGCFVNAKHGILVTRNCFGLQKVLSLLFELSVPVKMDYNRRDGHLEYWIVFASNNEVEVKEGSVNISVLTFINVCDKGCRAKMVAWICGHQKVLQPKWAESDKRNQRNQILLSVSVVADNGGNERGVNIYKRAWFLSSAFLPNMFQQMNYAWMAWLFQPNFMFNPVL